MSTTDQIFLLYPNAKWGGCLTAVCQGETALNRVTDLEKNRTLRTFRVRATVADVVPLDGELTDLLRVRPFKAIRLNEDPLQIYLHQGGWNAVYYTLVGDGSATNYLAYIEVVVETNLPRVYSAGDVIGDPMFVYIAAYGGHLAADNAINGNSRRYDLSVLPRVTFTDPQVASVGLTEESARTHGVDVMVATLPLSYVPRAMVARDTRGFIKLVADRGTRRLVGAHILAAEAGEMIQEPTLAIRHGIGIDDLASAFHPYLTLAEGIKLAAQTFTRDVKKLSCCAA